MPKKKKFETTLGELMSEMGVKKLPPRKKPPSPRAATATRPQTGQGAVAAAGTQVDARQEDRHRSEVRELLATVHELREQRGALRAELERRDKQIEQHLAEKAEMRAKLRKMEALRRTDLEQISRLRRETTSLGDRAKDLAQQRDRLLRTVDALQARATAAPAPALASDPLDALAERAGDSDLGEAALALARACRAAGLRRVVIVGGSPNYRQQLRELFGDALELRLVIGKERRTQAQARADLVWADAVLLWGGTILDHSLSQLYRGENVHTFAHRGLAGMLRLAAEKLG